MAAGSLTQKMASGGDFSDSNFFALALALAAVRS